jgi:outer membrane protein
MSHIMKRILFASAAIILLCGNLVAQDAPKQWALEECIRYAVENNVSLKQREQDEESRKVDMKASQSSWIPDVNVYFGQNVDFGRSPASDNVIVDRNSANSSLQAQVTMPVFNGFKLTNNMAVRKMNFKAATEALNKAREDLALNVASYYLQALYNKEILNIAGLQVNLTKEQLTKTEVLVEAGKVPMSQLYDMQAQLAKDEVTLTEAQNNVNLALLDLVQALEMERLGANFDIVQPEMKDAIADNIQSIIPPDNIYDNAITFKPQIKEQEFLLESRKKSLRVAQADYYPRLNFSAGYGNGYYRYFGADDIASIPLSDQIKQNERKTISLNVTIPIFNRFGVRSNVRQARIGIVNQELTIENNKKTLYKEIQQAYFTAIAAQEKYTASGKSVAASKEALTYAEERYTAGRSTVFEYNESKTKYAQSLSEQAQAKYSVIPRAKILDFYNGLPITL